MKKILLALLVGIMLVSCKKQETNKDELLKLFIDEETNTAFFVGTPSGIIYYATNSEVKPFMRDDKILNINDFMEVGNE